MATRRIIVIFVSMLLMLALAGVEGVQAQGGPIDTSFTYQGQLKESGLLANGAYDFQFSLYDAASGGSQVGSTLTREDVTVSDGLFTVTLDFGEVFDGSKRWLEIAVRPGNSTGAYTTLSPRQALTATPHTLALPGLYTLSNTTSPNVIGGYRGNSIAAGVVGATISGGGKNDDINQVSANYATISGGAGNTASHLLTTIGGGTGNTASEDYATVSGGYHNTSSGNSAVVAGGYYNEASGTEATVGGGARNKASGYYAFVGGGSHNTASKYGAAVGGGVYNVVVKSQDIGNTLWSTSTTLKVSRHR